MRKIYMTIKDRDGQPVRDMERALQTVRDYVADNYPKRDPDNIRVVKVNNNGDWAAYI